MLSSSNKSHPLFVRGVRQALSRALPGCAGKTMVSAAERGCADLQKRKGSAMINDHRPSPLLQLAPYNVSLEIAHPVAMRPCSRTEAELSTSSPARPRSGGRAASRGREAHESRESDRKAGIDAAIPSTSPGRLRHGARSHAFIGSADRRHGRVMSLSPPLSRGALVGGHLAALGRRTTETRCLNRHSSSNGSCSR